MKQWIGWQKVCMNNFPFLPSKFPLYRQGAYIMVFYDKLFLTKLVLPRYWSQSFLFSCHNFFLTLCITLSPNNTWKTSVVIKKSGFLIFLFFFITIVFIGFQEYSIANVISSVRKKWRLKIGNLHLKIAVKLVLPDKIFGTLLQLFLYYFTI